MRHPLRSAISAIIATVAALALTTQAHAEEAWAEHYNRARDFMSAKDFKAAEAEIIEAIGHADAFEADDDRLLQTLGMLGDIYRSTRQWAAASQQYENVLAAYRRRGIEQSQEASNLHNKLGVVYSFMKDQDKALEAFEASLAIKRKRYRQNAAGIAIVVTNLAELYRRKGRWDKAEKLHLEAIDDKELELGPEHSTLIASLNDLALVFRDQKKMAEALPYLERAIALARKSDHEGHRAELGTTIHNLAEVYAGTGKQPEALELYNEAETLRREVLGADHPHLAETLNSKANLLLGLGRGEEALPLYDEARRIRALEFGSNDPRTLNVMHNKALALDRLGKKDEAAALRAELQDLRTKKR